MPIDERWGKLTAEEWDDFARSWLAELSNPPPGDSGGLGLSVVMMNFTATAEQQWQFAQAAMSHAESDEELGAIAAGPIEHLLGHHGERYIDEIERQALTNAKFARMLAGVWQYKMSDDLWTRIQAIQKTCSPTG